jgi:hypothetical protein
MKISRRAPRHPHASHLYQAPSPPSPLTPPSQFNPLPFLTPTAPAFQRTDRSHWLGHRRRRLRLPRHRPRLAAPSAPKAPPSAHPCRAAPSMTADARDGRTGRNCCAHPYRNCTQTGTTAACLIQPPLHSKKYSAPNIELKRRSPLRNLGGYIAAELHDKLDQAGTDLDIKGYRNRNVRRIRLE